MLEQAGRSFGGTLDEAIGDAEPLPQPATDSASPTAKMATIPVRFMRRPG